MTDQECKVFETAYVAALLWSTPYDDNAEFFEEIADNIDDFDSQSAARIKADCTAFIARAGASLAGNYAQAGHDFALTRNGHGVGFWDRPEIYGGQANADMLTELAESFKEVYLYTNDGVIVGIE